MRLIFFYIIFALFMINRLFFFSPGVTEQTCSCLVYPLLKVQELLIAPLKTLQNYMESIKDLQERVDVLENERNNLQARLIAIDSLQNVYQDIKDLQEFASRYEVEQKRLGYIILRQFSDKEDVFFIDLGHSTGIQKDDVVVYENTIVGRVLEVYPKYSKVACITDSRCKISARSGKESIGICCGKNNRCLDFEFVPHFQPVVIDEMIISTGQGLVYPQGFGLGRIVSIKTDHVSHYIKAEPLIDLQKIKYVYVLFACKQESVS